MSSSVPRVEDITNAFPTPITTITGAPNYERLKTLKDQLKANAASIPTTLGGGNHGYLGLILSSAAYTTIAATQFFEPNLPAGTSAANTSTIIRCHTEALCQWREFKNVNTTLKNQLLSALDDIYVRALKDRHVGYTNQSICTILQHLFDNYGNITPLELEDKDTKMRATWDPTVLSIVSSNKSKTAKTRPTMVANPTPPNSSYASPTRLSSKQASTSKTAKTGTHVLPLHAPGTPSKCTSRLPNASYANKCAQQNKPASIATLHNINHYPQPNHQRNIKKPSSTWPPLWLLITNSSPNWLLLLPPSTNTSTHSTSNPHNCHPLSKPTTTQTPPQQRYPLSLLPSPNYNNNSKNSIKEMCLSATVTRDDPASAEKMEITAGYIDIALETNIPAQPAKTKHQAKKTKPPKTIQWAVALPTNLTTYDIQGGVFLHLRIN